MEFTPMKVSCTIIKLDNGRWHSRHSGSSLGTVEVSGSSREEALAKMRDELQYRIELCPCSGVSGDTVVLEVTQQLESRL
jgi:hypothetical protein